MIATFKHHSPPLFSARRAHAIVEFALLFPFFVLTILLLLEAVTVGLEQIILQHDAAALARFMSCSRTASSDDMVHIATDFGAAHFRTPTRITLRLNDLPVVAPPTGVRKKRLPVIVRLVLERPSTLAPFAVPVRVRRDELCFLEAYP